MNLTFNHIFRWLFASAVICLPSCHSSSVDEPTFPTDDEYLLKIDEIVYTEGIKYEISDAISKFFAYANQSPENHITVTLESPGTLESVLSGKTEDMDALTVSGPMDKTDLRYISDYAAGHYLINLDLSEAEFKDNKIPDEAMVHISNTTAENGQTVEYCMQLPIFHLVLPKNIKEIGSSAFAGLLLMDLDLPKTVNKLGAFCFLGNAIGDGELIIPDGVTVIPRYAFYSYLLEQIRLSTSPCSSAGTKDAVKLPASASARALDRIVLPSSVKKVENFAFTNLQAKKLDLGNKIEEIWYNAFSNNKALETLILPPSLKAIHSSCFAHLPALKEIYTNNPQPPFADYSGNGLLCVEWMAPYAFNCEDSFCEDCEHMYSDVIVHVPDGSIEDYYFANGWRNFDNYSEI